MTNSSYDDDRPAEETTRSALGSREEQLSRLDKLERDIAIERERLNRPEARPSQTDPRDGVDGVREVDLPDLESKVTESQREAWTLGYQAGLADAQAGGRSTANPFHPLRESRV